VGSKRRIFSAPERTRVRFGRSRSSKVDDFSTSRKPVCDLILVGHCNYGSILHRFWDTAIYWLKIAYFSYPSLIRRPHSLCSLWNFAVKLTTRKLESWGYPTVKTHDRSLSHWQRVGIACYAERCLSHDRFCLSDTVPACDGRTDGRTDLRLKKWPNT